SNGPGHDVLGPCDSKTWPALPVYALLPASLPLGDVAPEICIVPEVVQEPVIDYAKAPKPRFGDAVQNPRERFTPVEDDAPRFPDLAERTTCQLRFEHEGGRYLYVGRYVPAIMKRDKVRSAHFQQSLHH